LPSSLLAIYKELLSSAISIYRRVLTSIANSVLLEHAFSNINYIYSKTRNSLDVERANKLQFVYINAKHLKQQQEADTLERLQA